MKSDFRLRAVVSRKTVLNSGLGLRWRLDRGRLFALVTLLGIALLLAAVGAITLYRMLRDVGDLHAILTSESALSLAAGTVITKPEKSERSDFSSVLPAAIDSQPMVAEVQRAASAAEQTFLGAQIQSREVAAGQLARTEFVLSLHGSYSGSKNVAAKLLNRFPNSTLVRLSFRKNGAPAELDATMVLALWGATSSGNATDSRSEAGR